MSARANPTVVGLFMLGALVLTLVGIASLASSSWIDRPSTFVSYFEESVNGLEVGAAVKFQGVPVGQVTDLLIQIGETDKSFQVPVQYDVDLTRLTSAGRGFIDLDDPVVLREQIAAGLRAQLQMESLVTGQLYIELVYRVQAPEPRLEELPTAYPQIPTSPSLLAAFGTQAGSVVGDVLKILIRIDEMLAAIQMEEINEAVVASAEAVERLAGSPEVQAAIAGIPAMTAQFTSAMSGVQGLIERMDQAAGPLGERLAETNEELNRTLQTTQQAMQDLRGLLSADSGVGYQTEGAMASLKEAAEAMRALALSLERNPDMLIRGRKSGGR